MPTLFDDDDPPPPPPWHPLPCNPRLKPPKWRLTPAAQRAGDLGMARAGRKLLTPEGQVFEQQARLAIRTVATAKPYFTVDDVWAAMPCAEDEKIFYGSALGPLMKSMAKDGVMTRTDHRPSGRGPTHGRPVTLWQSNLYR